MKIQDGLILSCMNIRSNNDVLSGDIQEGTSMKQTVDKTKLKGNHASRNGVPEHKKQKSYNV